MNKSELASPSLARVPARFQSLELADGFARFVESVLNGISIHDHYGWRCYALAMNNPNDDLLVTSKNRFSLSELTVLGFTLIYMAVALIASFYLRNSEFLFYFVVMLVLITAISLVHWHNRLHLGALWGLSIWGLAHMAGGLMPIPQSWPTGGDSYVLYNWWLIPGLLKYDQVVHAYGFGLVTWICWQSLRAAFASRSAVVEPSFGLLTLCVASGMGFGAANEIIEFIATLTLAGTNVGGYENTGWDLVSNLVGCVTTALMIGLDEKRQRYGSLAQPTKP